MRSPHPPAMAHQSKSNTLIGSLQRLLFSPKGGIEGLLMTVDSQLVQISMATGSADAQTLCRAIGQPIEVKASADHSPKTKAGAHPVYQLDRIIKLAGKAFRSTSDAPSLRGIVATLHYAKHGEPNGVILESGEFIHTRPPGMEKLKLDVGSKVVAHGDIRMTVLGTVMIEAHKVNRVSLE